MKSIFRYRRRRRSQKATDKLVEAFVWLIAIGLILYGVYLGLSLLGAIIITGLGLFLTPFAILSATLIVWSPTYRNWLSNRRSYIQRLSWLPGINSTSPKLAALAILTYTLPLGIISLFMTIRIIVDENTSQVNTINATIFVGFGFIFVFFSYFGFVLGYGRVQNHMFVKRIRASSMSLTDIQELEQLQSLDPIEFENFIGSVFENLGYEVNATATTGDEGIDLFLRRMGKVVIVQCKRYRNNVGQPVVRDLYGSMMHVNADEAYLITTGAISRQAQAWVLGKPIHLVDGTNLVKWLDDIEDNAEKYKQAEMQLQPEATEKKLAAYMKTVFGIFSGIVIESVLIVAIYFISLKSPELSNIEMEIEFEITSDISTAIKDTSIYGTLTSTPSTVHSPSPTATHTSTPTLTKTSKPASTTQPQPSTPVSTLSSTLTELYIKANQAINARSCPQTNCDVITVFYPKQIVLGVEAVEGDEVAGSTVWIKIKYDDREVYIHSSLLASQMEVTPTTIG